MPFGSYLLNSTAKPAHFHANWAELAVQLEHLEYDMNCTLVDKTGEVALTIGGLSGIFKGHDYLKGRFERTPYDKSSMRSVYHVRNIDEFRLKSMPPGNYIDYRI